VKISLSEAAGDPRGNADLLSARSDSQVSSISLAAAGGPGISTRAVKAMQSATDGGAVDGRADAGSLARTVGSGATGPHKRSAEDWRGGRAAAGGLAFTATGDVSPKNNETASAP
jgi:hypothetical protein